MKTQTIRNKVLIKKDPAKEKTEGGLYLPEVMQSELAQPTTVGTVVDASGKGYNNLAGQLVLNHPELKPGTRVLFEKNFLTDAKELGESLAFIENEHIIAIIED